MKKPNPAFVNAPYCLTFLWHGEPPSNAADSPLRFSKPPPPAAWRDVRKFAAWARKNAVKPYLP